MSFTISDVGALRLCWSVGDIGTSGQGYASVLLFTVSEPVATCVGPARISAGLLSTFNFKGQGLSLGDAVKFVDASLGCDAMPVGGGEMQTLGTGSSGVNARGLAATVEATIASATTVTALTACYRYLRSTQGFKAVGRVRIEIADPIFYSYSPSTIWTDQTFSLSVVGAGLASGQRIKVIRADQECTNIFASDASGGAEKGVICVADPSGTVTCSADFTITQETADNQNGLRLCYSYTSGVYVDVGSIELRLPSVSSFEPSQVFAGAATLLTLSGAGFKSTLAK